MSGILIASSAQEDVEADSSRYIYNWWSLSYLFMMVCGAEWLIKETAIRPLLKFALSGSVMLVRPSSGGQVQVYGRGREQERGVEHESAKNWLIREYFIL